MICIADDCPWKPLQFLFLCKNRRYDRQCCFLRFAMHFIEYIHHRTFQTPVSFAVRISRTVQKRIHQNLSLKKMFSLLLCIQADRCRKIGSGTASHNGNILSVNAIFFCMFIEIDRRIICILNGCFVLIFRAFAISYRSYGSSKLCTGLAPHCII